MICMALLFVLPISCHPYWTGNCIACEVANDPVDLSKSPFSKPLNGQARSLVRVAHDCNRTVALRLQLCPMRF